VYAENRTEEAEEVNPLGGLPWEEITVINVKYKCYGCYYIHYEHIHKEQMLQDLQWKDLMIDPLRKKYGKWLAHHPLGTSKRKYAQTTLDTAVSLKKPK
jgi:hypothetical protein